MQDCGCGCQSRPKLLDPWKKLGLQGRFHVHLFHVNLSFDSQPSSARCSVFNSINFQSQEKMVAASSSRTGHSLLARPPRRDGWCGSNFLFSVNSNLNSMMIQSRMGESCRQREASIRRLSAAAGDSTRPADKRALSMQES